MGTGTQCFIFVEICRKLILIDQPKGDIMSKVLETGLIIRKESNFDKIRKSIYQIFFKKEYLLEMEINNITKVNRPNPKDIVIPREIILKK